MVIPVGLQKKNHSRQVQGISVEYLIKHLSKFLFQNCVTCSILMESVFYETSAEIEAPKILRKICPNGLEEKWSFSGNRYFRGKLLSGERYNCNHRCAAMR
mmetsp:Transcript_65055/g.89421  ORF Transcript_65055/g.89421 Transcript_65055/m.89421 type:complete len:101 (+) Transcript_65055:402-704(+)